MQFLGTPINGLFEIHLQKRGDARGWFMRTFDEELFQQHIPDFSGRWLQMNHSFSAQRNTWRGFHFQKHPYGETKVVRCVSGKVLDCILDLRQHSATYLQVYQLELSAANGIMLYIPKGCAHGFLTLEEDVELVYMHDTCYRPDYEAGVRFDDPAIQFSLPTEPAVISERDKNFPDYQL